MLNQILGIKQRREDAAVKAEIQSRLELEQAASELRAEQQRKSDYETWMVEERERLYDDLQQRDAVKYDDLMHWNAQVADIKQGLLDIEARLMELERVRQEKMDAHQITISNKQHAQQQVVKFNELVEEERRVAILEQEIYEERELEDFRRPEL